MRVVIDTNILVSAQIAPDGNPAAIVDAGFFDGRFTLLTSDEQDDELRATLNKPRIAALIKPHKAGAWSTRSGNSPCTWASSPTSSAHPNLRSQS